MLVCFQNNQNQEKITIKETSPIPKCLNQESFQCYATKIEDILLIQYIQKKMQTRIELNDAKSERGHGEMI